MAAELKETERSQEPILIELPGIIDIPGRAKEIHELIARRAYALYEGRGRVDGHDKDDWLEAKSDVVATLCAGFMELNEELRIDLGITTCELSEFQVTIEPRRLIVSGKSRVPDGGMAQSCPRGRPRPSEIFQVIDFPVQVEPSGARATLSNGLLEFRIPKVGNVRSRESSLT